MSSAKETADGFSCDSRRCGSSLWSMIIGCGLAKSADSSSNEFLLVLGVVSMIPFSSA